jgi:hypothetical protein
MKKWTLLILALTWLTPGLRAQSYNISWYKVAGGGGTSSGGTYSVSGTIGQPDAGPTLTGGSYSVTGGFWSLISAVQSPGTPDLTITYAGNTVFVSWPAVGTYTLQQNSSLAGGSWVNSSYGVSSSNGTNSVGITPPVGNLYFRLSNP